MNKLIILCLLGAFNIGYFYFTNLIPTKIEGLILLDLIIIGFILIIKHDANVSQSEVEK